MIDVCRVLPVEHFHKTVMDRGGLLCQRKGGEVMEEFDEMTENQSV